MYDIYIIYIWYIHGILHVYAVLIDMSGIYLVKTSWVCSVPFFLMICLGYTMNILGIFILYPRYIIIKKGMEQTHEVLTRYIPDISLRTAYTCNTPCIYHVYTMNIHAMSDIPVLFNVYSMYILYILYLVNTMYIPCIYIVYTMYILSTYNVYYQYILGIYTEYIVNIHSIY